MQEAVSIGVGSMSAISGIDMNVIEDECKKHSINGEIAVISNYNSPDQIVISGHRSIVEAVGEKLAKLGGRVVSLKVSAPFHSPLMQPAADRLKEELEKYTYAGMKYPVLSNVTARPYTGHEEIVRNLVDQVVKPVKWHESMEYLKSQGVGLAMEIGPQAVLRNLMRKNALQIQAYSYDKDEDIQAFKKEVSTAGQPGKVRERGPSFLARCMAIAVCTRNTNWDNDEYQRGVVEPYKKIQQMQDELDQNWLQPTKEQMMQALEMLRSVFITKRTPIEEQIERFNQIFEETGTRDLLSDFKMPS